MRACVVDLFCGVGGLSYGFAKEGFDVVAGIDSDASCAYAYEKNVGGKFISSDIRAMTDEELVGLFPSDTKHAKVLVGCAPCQPFSAYTRRYRIKGFRAKAQWRLLKDFLRAVRATKPAVVSMENVARVTKHKVFKEFIRELGDLGYTVTYQLVRAHHYGVPQKRTRLVLFASKLGEIRLIEPTHKANPRTVRQAIGHLPKIGAVKTEGDVAIQ